MIYTRRHHHHYIPVATSRLRMASKTLGTLQIFKSRLQPMTLGFQQYYTASFSSLRLSKLDNSLNRKWKETMSKRPDIFQISNARATSTWSVLNRDFLSTLTITYPWTSNNWHRLCSIKGSRQNSAKFNTTTSCQNIVIQHESHLELAIPGGQTLFLPYIWLRDHCRSERCYNHQTNQKNVDLDLMKRDLVPQTVEAGDGRQASLHITWRDGHKTEFPFTWLVENFYPGQFSSRVERKFWDAQGIATLPEVPYKDHMTSDEGLRKTLHNLVKFGFAIVTGCPASEAGTQEVVERITFVKETLFGGMWSFTADASRSDTAYSTIALGPHTDMTYMDNPAGIQVFHCLEHTGTGGETLLVDGFHAVDQLHLQNPAAFDLLCKTVVPHEYVEPAGPNSPGYHLYSLGTVITVHPASREIMHLRFNPYDRAPLNSIKPKDIPDFYAAYDQLCHIIGQEDNHLWVKLKPGMVIIIDNWRVMHGRAAFDGKRIMCGCYLGREEWTSRARIYGVL